MFRSVQVVVINKMDLAPYLDFDMELFRANLEKVNPGVKVIEVSAKTGEGIRLMASTPCSASSSRLCSARWSFSLKMSSRMVTRSTPVSYPEWSPWLVSLGSAR